MIEIPSKIEGEQYHLFKLEQKLKPIGYSIGGNWDYDHGAFDYKIDAQEGYHFLRVPFKAIDGQLDTSNCTVELGRPFLLSHIYEEGTDHDYSNIGNFSASFNQFAEPVDKDGKVPEQYVDTGKSLVEELEDTLLNY
ncbi:YugN-like protein [Cytobacillus horneckiae]|uniref:YugN-like family protein n=1 Tax=Cytobacillus horneckiae TaxID=549687 RepID=A0A2N0ZE64_9BACI|nr:YugN-like family protein [Cytobacillus horneckiae]NRG45706.1 hypothetical protein [Bacillus sp. CRN 9]MBN6889021.1 YugN-like family protein [Cytobacillus horneckiae]MCM3180791.1 YugN-like family protein [Cytobacillus horneckiae]MEC1157504.1 YugN-like family protein [Cytobacillus horneckiae]MED2939452.1 YugN-like family protein [Cytobacillus horneckiae]